LKNPIQFSTQKDNVTVLICAGGKSATKKFINNKGNITKIGYDAGLFFGVMTKPVSNIADLSGILTVLESIPKAFIIRGELLAHFDKAAEHRRLKDIFPSPLTGRYWVLIDFDKIKVPDYISLQRDPVAAMEYLISLLSAEFQNVSYHWQLSSSAGMSDTNTLSAHIWFWFSRPVTDLELRAWAKSVNDRAKYKLVDSALFRDVQPHYTAAPIFKDVTNPFPVRSGLVVKSGDEVVLRAPSIAQVIKVIDAKKTAHGLTKHHISNDNITHGTKFDMHLSCIGDHTDGEGFHEPIIRAIASYVASNGRDGTDPEQLYSLVSARVMCADRSQHPDNAYIEHMASRAHIMPAIKTAMLKFGDSARKKSRLIAGIAPPKRGKRLMVNIAYETLENIISRWC